MLMFMIFVEVEVFLRLNLVYLKFVSGFLRLYRNLARGERLCFLKVMISVLVLNWALLLKLPFLLNLLLYPRI